MKTPYSVEERSVLFVTTLTSFMGPFMISSVNVALPAIQKDFMMDAVQLSWVATAYLLAVAVGLLPAGKIGDIRGRKKVFVTGIAVYTIGAVLAAISNSAGFFIILRVFQGAGAALFVATGMAILTSVFPPQKRGRVIGIYVSAVYVGLSMGPFIGGFITQQLGWRVIFWLMLPLGSLSFWLTMRYLKEELQDESSEKLDLFGCLLYGTSIVFLVYGASKVPTAPGLVLLPLGLAGLLIFAYQQARSRYPVIELTLFRTNRVFAFSSYAALLHYSATFGVTFLLSLYLQYIKGLSPQQAGMIIMAQPVMMACFSPLAGRLSDYVEPRLLASGGMFITAIGVFLFSRLSPDSVIPVIFINLIFLGIGFALFSSPNMSAMMGAVEKRHYGLASGLVATMRLLGQMSSMAIVTVILATKIGRSATIESNLDQFLASVQIAFILSALLCLLGTYFSWYRGNVQRQVEEK